MVAGGLRAFDSQRGHDSAQVVSFDEQVERAIALVVDHGTVDVRSALHDHLRQLLLDLLQGVQQRAIVVASGAGRIDAHHVVAARSDSGFELEFLGVEDGAHDRLTGDAKLECFDGAHVQLDAEVALRRTVKLFDVFAHFAQRRLLNAPLDDARGFHVARGNQRTRDDRGRNDLRTATRRQKTEQASSKSAKCLSAQHSIPFSTSDEAKASSRTH
jgi:hypothetical protein